MYKIVITNLVWLNIISINALICSSFIELFSEQLGGLRDVLVMKWACREYRKENEFVVPKGYS